MFWAKIWKISDFLSENFQFLVVKFSIYLNRRVFVMTSVWPVSLCRYDLQNLMILKVGSERCVCVDEYRNYVHQDKPLQIWQTQIRCHWMLCLIRIYNLVQFKTHFEQVVKWTCSNFNSSLAEHDRPCLSKQCRSRSLGFWRSQLIWFCTVCHLICEFLSKTQIK